MCNFRSCAFCVVLITRLLLPGLAFSQKDTVRIGKNKEVLVFPVIAKSIETGWSFGAASAVTFHISKADTATRTSNMQGIALYSLKKQFITAINGAEYFRKERFVLNEQLSYSSFPDKFWGLGKYAPDSAVEPYNFKQYYIYLHLLRKLSKGLYLGTLFELQKVFDVGYKPGGLFDQKNIAGRYGYLVAGLGLSFTYDNRNNAFAPDKGNFAQIYFDHFDKYLGSQYVYTNVVVDLRRFIKIYHKQVLALQAYGFADFGDEIPLRSLASLGGSGSMRGFYQGRYRDRDMLVFQGEYRIPVRNRFGVVAFANTGDVGHSLSDFSIPDFKFSFGGGLRYAINKSERLNLRLDYGTSFTGNSGLYFQLGEAF